MQSRASLELSQHQQLVLTPQLRQALRLLQCSTQELEQEIATALAENPVLEQEDPPAPDAWIQAEMLERHWMQGGRQPVSDNIPESADSQTLADHLLQQLRMTRVSQADQHRVAFLIGELGDRACLGFDPLSPETSMPPELGGQTSDWQLALNLLQSFDPVGVGARDLPECLRLQLKAQGEQWPPDTLDCALRLSAHLPDLAAGRWGRLCQALQCTREQLDAAHQLLRRMEPNPAAPWQDDLAAYVVPDVLFYRTATGWQTSLNPSLAHRLRLDPTLVHQIDADPSGALRDQVRHAQQLIQQLGQRRTTILRVADFIAGHQQAYLEHGEADLKPLVLREVAQALELHESTISRATRLKYAQTPWGVIELKHFFGAEVANQAGEATTAAAVQAVMRRLLEAESPDKPLSDARLTRLLADGGVVIARRTVAKYREAMGVPVASLRKKPASD